MFQVTLYCLALFSTLFSIDNNRQLPAITNIGTTPARYAQHGTAECSNVNNRCYSGILGQTTTVARCHQLRPKTNVLPIFIIYTTKE